MAQARRSRSINTSRVMREIWIHKEISRVQIANNLGLDKSTITSIVNPLLCTGILRETAEGAAGPQGGRRPVLLTVNRSYGCVLGIELRAESCTAVAVDLEGNILYSKLESVRLNGNILRDVFPEITGRIRAELRRPGVPVLGIGVAVPGVVNPEIGLNRCSIPLQTADPFEFGERIARGHDLPLFLENDANACAWGELAFHRTEHLRDFLFLLVEFRDLQDRERSHDKSVLRMGVVIDGRVHHGHNHSAGGFRSIFCTPECKGQFSLAEEEAFRIEEDPQILSRFIRELSRNVAMIVNTFNLGHVFLGGHIERYRNEVQAVLAEEIQLNRPYPEEAHCQIRFSSLGEKAVPYGAAAMVLHHLCAGTNTTDGFGWLLASVGSSLSAGPAASLSAGPPAPAKARHA
jgi:predicted NBD/HSP70 family sugar kinase